MEVPAHPPPVPAQNEIGWVPSLETVMDVPPIPDGHFCCLTAFFLLLQSIVKHLRILRRENEKEGFLPGSNSDYFFNCM